MQRIYIFLSVFFAGASLMSLEMAGFRLVQPEFGSDIIIWGSLISVFLGGLSLGAFTGGKLADRWPSMLILGGILMFSGLVVVFMPLYSDGVFNWLSQEQEFLIPMDLSSGSSAAEPVVYKPPDLRWTILSAGLILFFIPSLLMGMVCPYSAKLLIKKMPNIGKGVGKISAVSTLGSIVGTLGTTFYLIQILGTRSLILMNGILLLAIGAGALVFPILAKEHLRSAVITR